MNKEAAGNSGKIQTLGTILVRSLGVDPDAVERAEAEASQRKTDPAAVFLEKKLVDETGLQQARGLLFDLPFMADLPLDRVDVSLVRKLPAGWLKRHLVLPLLPEPGDDQGPEALVAVYDPSRFQLIDPVIRLTGKRRVQVVVSPKAAILSGIHLSYDVSPDSAERLVRDMERGDGGSRKKVEDTADLLDDVSDAPVIKLVNHLISRSVKAGASDIHIEPYRDSFKIRYRVDGILYDMIDPPKWIQASLVSRIKVMADLNIAEKRLPQDGRMAVKVGDQLIDVRLSTVPTGFGERVVMRLLNKSMDLLHLSELGFSPNDLGKIKNLLDLPNGILLVTGPTGSGKTTTLYAALSHLNTADRNIITIEDPVEYQIKGISQIQVNPKIGLTFASGLRSIVRQDPDVILVGEIRDRETADIAVQSALTGHLVFSTLHTTDAASAMIRLVDIGVEPFLISSSVAAVAAQRLVRRLCPDCKQLVAPDPSALAGVGLDEKSVQDKSIFREKGCEACLSTGYRGRTGIYEIMPVTDAVRKTVLDSRDAGEIRKAALEGGMKTLRDHGAQKVLEGVTSIAEVLRVTQ